MYSMNDAMRKKKVVSDDMEAVSLKHHHPIDEIDGLSASLANLSSTKSDVNHTHETLNDVKILKLSLSTVQSDVEQDNNDKSYAPSELRSEASFTFFVDDAGNLNILNDDLVIGKYIPSERDWMFGEISLKEVDSTLENHYKALTKIKQVLKEAGLILVNSQ